MSIARAVTGPSIFRLEVPFTGSRDEIVAPFNGRAADRLVTCGGMRALSQPGSPIFVFARKWVPGNLVGRFGEYSAVRPVEVHVYGATALLAFVVAASAITSPSGGPASINVESHCVVGVVDQLADGAFVFGTEVCFGSLNGALAFASDGEFTEGELLHLSGPELIADPERGVALLTFTLGIHFDGSNGTGSSKTIVGGSCTGGYWNTGGTWANRISSSWNGCSRLRHYDNPNKSGASADTTGIGQTKNLPSAMNNKTESVAYFGS